MRTDLFQSFHLKLHLDHLFLAGTLMGTGVKGRFTEMVTFELCPEECVRFLQMYMHGVGSPRLK